ncbi:MarR family winged helix-turn-helix transcriptional regulator [Cohnella sp. 56]|uniref:MarR family winged helix-turn-helix transcriptional regulator n=1 Tax=Cohnella sp. 56 TaxID=3113722 RepID=UPI0030E7C7F1
MDELSSERIGDALLDVFKAFARQDRKNREYGIDEPLYHSEVYTLSEIREHEGIHITALAERCGVTKGAISQVLKKLDQKGLVVKEKDARNQSRIMLKLSPKGEQAYLRHLEHQDRFKSVVAASIGDMPDEAVLYINRFLAELGSKLAD